VPKARFLLVAIRGLGGALTVLAIFAGIDPGFRVTIFLQSPALGTEAFPCSVPIVSAANLSAPRRES